MREGGEGYQHSENIVVTMYTDSFLIFFHRSDINPISFPRKSPFSAFYLILFSISNMHLKKTSLVHLQSLLCLCLMFSHLNSMAIYGSFASNVNLPPIKRIYDQSQVIFDHKVKRVDKAVMINKDDPVYEDSGSNCRIKFNMK